MHADIQIRSSELDKVLNNMATKIRQHVKVLENTLNIINKGGGNTPRFDVKLLEYFIPHIHDIKLRPTIF